MNMLFIGNTLGFYQTDEIVHADRAISMNIEKTFHCAALKGLVAHLGFLIEPENPEALSPKWGRLYDTSVAFVRNKNIDTIIL
jgi:hypothetical protein